MERSIPDKIDRFITAIDRLASAIESFTSAQKGLGGTANTRYTHKENEESSDSATEQEMAEKLGIPQRTLGNYRRQGRIPNCWVRNGGRIVWKVAESQAAWDRGIA